jgi:hypothetical protein
LLTAEGPFVVDSVPLLVLVAVGAVWSVLVSEVGLTDALADAPADALAFSWETEEDAPELAAAVSAAVS